jgi:hydroxymethylbilane synthase
MNPINDYYPGIDMIPPLRIGTRGSPLALWQANHVAGLLRAVAPDRAIELVEIQTAGDQVRDVSLAQIGGEGVFTRAIQQALLNSKVDVAVHSLKDLPTIPVAGLVLAGVPKRGPNGDVLVSGKHRSFADLPNGAVLATSSLRRRAQVLHRRPDLKLVDIRGNVETRLRKLTENNLDGLLLAHAGLERLGLAGQITEILDPVWMLPAVGQGALGVECRTDDKETCALVAKINDRASAGAVRAERAMLRELGGGCHVPIGAATVVEGATLTLHGAVLSPEGSRRIEAQVSGPLPSGEGLGKELAMHLLRQGASELLHGNQA